MATALFRKLRLLLRYPLSGFIGGGRVWHAPAPTPYRVPAQPSQTKVFVPRARHGRWDAPLSTAAKAAAAGNAGRPGDDAIWKALLEIRDIAEKGDINSSENATKIISQLKDMLSLVNEMHGTYTSRPGYVGIFMTLFLLLWIIYYLGAETTIEAVDEFVTPRVNKVVTDPETQQNLKASALMAGGHFLRRINPWYKVKGWLLGQDEEGEITFAELMAKKSFLALTIVLVIRVYSSTGTSLDELMEGLQMIGKTDSKPVLEMLGVLQANGYIGQRPMKLKDKDWKMLYWLTDLAIKDAKSGVLEKKVLLMVKEDMKNKAAKKNAK